MGNYEGTLVIHQRIVGDLLKKDIVVHGEKRQKKNKRWHDTQLLLNVYRQASWSITNEIHCIGELREVIAYPKSFERIEKYMEVLQELLQNNVEAETIQSDGSRTLERARALSLSCLLLKDIHMALERVRTYPQCGEAYYQILYYCYFSDLGGETIITKRSLGFKTVLQYALKDGVNIIYDERRFYQLKSEATRLFDNVLWGLTTQEIISGFIEMYREAI